MRKKVRKRKPTTEEPQPFRRSWDIALSCGGRIETVCGDTGSLITVDQAHDRKSYTMIAHVGGVTILDNQGWGKVFLPYEITDHVAIMAKRYKNAAPTKPAEE